MRLFYLARIDVATEDASTHHVFEFCRAFARLGNSVTLFVPDMGTRRSLQGVTLRYVPVGVKKASVTYVTFYLSLIPILAAACLRYRPDVVYTRHQAMEWIVTWLKWVFGFVYVIEINGLAPVELKINRMPEWWIRVVQIMERFNLRMADRIVTPSRLIRDYLRKNYCLSEKRFLVVSNGADPETSHPMDKQECRRQLGLAQDKKILVFVGSLKQWHGIDRIVYLMPDLVREIPDLHLLIVGDGEKRPALQQWVSEQKLDHAIFLVGRVPHQKVACYINAADICLAPYFEEGLNETGISPLKIFEYMACARPIITNPVGGLDELFRNRDIGIMIDSKDPRAWLEPIASLLRDPERMERLGRNGHDAVTREFSWEAICRKIAADLGTLISEQ